MQLCGQIDDMNGGEALGPIDEDGPMESSVSSRTSQAINTGGKFKDRTSIEDFEIIKPISRGAFGRVFLAKKRVTGDLFAIKVLKKADMIRKNAVESILAERDILISARNPFVVSSFFFFFSFTSDYQDTVSYLTFYLVMGRSDSSTPSRVGKTSTSSWSTSTAATSTPCSGTSAASTKTWPERTSPNWSVTFLNTPSRF